MTISTSRVDTPGTALPTYEPKPARHTTRIGAGGRNVVRLVDVFLRDGLQSLPNVFATPAKIEVLDQLVAAGIDTLEVTSFVSRRWVPQLSDAEDVLGAANARHPGLRSIVVVPNLVGLERALNAGATEINQIVSATDSHSRANLNQSLEHQLLVAEAVTRAATESGVRVRVTISVAFGCPFEGHVAPEVVSSIAGRMVDAGASEVAFADTSGVGKPTEIESRFARWSAELAPADVAAHLHSTRGETDDKIRALFFSGVRTIDTSLGGIGRCPFTPSAPANLDTALAVGALRDLGVPVGADLDRLGSLLEYIHDTISGAKAKSPRGRSTRAVGTP